MHEHWLDVASLVSHFEGERSLFLESPDLMVSQPFSVQTRLEAFQLPEYHKVLGCKVKILPTMEAGSTIDLFGCSPNEGTFKQSVATNLIQ
jgi:hypothetical protein